MNNQPYRDLQEEPVATRIMLATQIVMAVCTAIMMITQIVSLFL